MMQTIISICTWCPDAAQQEATVLKENPKAVISHGICNKCKKELEQEFNSKCIHKPKKR